MLSFFSSLQITIYLDQDISMHSHLHLSERDRQTETGRETEIMFAPIFDLYFLSE